MVWRNAEFHPSRGSELNKLGECDGASRAFTSCFAGAPGQGSRVKFSNCIPTCTESRREWSLQHLDMCTDQRIQRVCQFHVKFQHNDM